jgi:hypothetical protein
MAEPENPLTGKPVPKLKLNKKVQVILICLFFSSLCWILIALSKDYVAHVTFKLKYENVPDHYQITNELPETMKLTLQTSGFRILSARLSKTYNPVIIDVAAKLPGNNYIPMNVALPSKALAGDFAPLLGDEFTILNYSPDTIFFSFSK